MLEFDFKYDGLGMGTLAFNSMSGIGRGGTGELRVDGNVVATQKMENTMPLILQWDESLDIGAESEAKRPPIPTEGGHRFRSKAATRSGRRRPPC